MEETLEIKYLVKAVDQATQTLAKIDKSLASVNSQMEQAKKVNKEAEKSNKGLLDSYRRVSGAVADTVSTFKNFYDFLVNLDFKKIVRALTLIGFLLKFKGLDSLGNLFLKTAGQVDVMATAFNKVNDRLKETQERYGSLTGALLETTGINKVIGFLGEMAIDLAIAAVAVVGFASAAAAFKIFEKAATLAVVSLGVLNKNIAVSASRLADFSRASSGLTRTLADFASRGLFVVSDALGRLNIKIIDASIKAIRFGNAFNTVGRNTVSITKSVGKATLATEVFERGIFGATARLATFGASFTALGRLLLQTDSILGKIAGTTLIGLALALTGLAAVLKSFSVTIGEFIQKVGTGMVQAANKAIDKMQKLRGETFVFGFIIKNLNKETKGATGTLQEWNETMERVGETTGYSRSELQKSTSELLRVGESIGLTKTEMEELLPIITDLAAANHKDLFSSTLAVVEGLAGQTVMLQNMGINLSQAALKESKYGQQLGTTIQKLTEHEKVALRLNVLRSKSKTINGIAAASLQTVEGASRSAERAQEKLNASLGAGAVIVEDVFRSNLANLTNNLAEMSQGGLKVIGFLQAFIGRVLQITGLVVKWSFTTVLLISTLKALNIVLANQVISQYIAGLSQSVLVTQKLASVSPIAAKAVSAGLARVATAGLSVTGVFSALSLATAAMAKATLVLLAPFLIIAAKIAIVVGVLYLLYQAFKRIDEQTKIFTNALNALQAWWDSSSVFGDLGKALSFLGKEFQVLVVKGIFFVADALVQLRIAFISVKAFVIGAVAAIENFYEALVNLDIVQDTIAAIAKYWNLVKTSIFGVATEIRVLVEEFFALQTVQEIINFVRVLIKAIGIAIDAVITKVQDWGDKFEAFLGALPKKLFEAVFGQAAYAEEVKKTTANIVQLSKEEQKRISDTDAQIIKQKELQEALKAKRQAEIDAIRNGVAETEKAENIKTGHIKHGIQQRIDLLGLFAEEKRVVDLENAELDKINQELINNEEIQSIIDHLGRTTALKEIARIREIEAEARHAKTVEEKRKKHGEALNQIAKIRAKKEQQEIFSVQKFEELTNKQRFQNMQQTLGMISSLTSNKNKELFIIGKAAAIAQAIVNTSLGYTRALAAAPPPFSFALAGLVATAGALQIAKIASQKPPSYYSGGIIPGPKTGDQVPVLANGGEMMLSGRQQRTLFDSINNDNIETTETDSGKIDQLIEAMENRPIMIEINGREIAKVIRDEKRAGNDI